MRFLLLLLLPACAVPEVESLGFANNMVGPVPTGLADQWTTSASFEHAQFDRTQGTFTAIQAPGPFFTPGPQIVVATEMRRVSTAFTYSTGRFTFAGVLGGTDSKGSAWKDNTVARAVGVRAAARLFDIGPVAFGLSSQASDNRSGNARVDTAWSEIDTRLGFALRPASCTRVLLSPYGGVGHRRIDGRQGQGINQEPSFDADLTYGFVGVALELTGTPIQCFVETAVGDLDGVQAGFSLSF